jgi:FMN phosphatase YigB (HAD superfamily)
VSTTLEVPMNEIAFFDDSRENVNAAVALGMHAHHVTGFGDLTVLLGRMGILNREGSHPIQF